MNACSTVSFSPNRRLLNKRAALKLMRKLLKTQGFPKADIGTWAAGRIYEYTR